jgi:hypothetical protein
LITVGSGEDCKGRADGQPISYLLRNHDVTFEANYQSTVQDFSSTGITGRRSGNTERT